MSRAGSGISEWILKIDVQAVLPEPLLRPETQDATTFAEGIHTIVTTNKRVAEAYISDGSAEMACPPLKALLHIMAKGDYEGLRDPAFRAMFTREAVVKSDWYRQRLTMFRDRERDRLLRGMTAIQVPAMHTRMGKWSLFARKRTRFALSTCHVQCLGTLPFFWGGYGGPCFVLLSSNSWTSRSSPETGRGLRLLRSSMYALRPAPCSSPPPLPLYSTSRV